MRRAAFPIVLLTLILGAHEPTSAELSAARGGPTTLIGRVGTPEARDSVTFEITYYREEFRLSSVRDKYKLVRVRISNYSATPLRLSAERDQLDLVSPDNVAVRGLLDLQSADASMWDTFDSSLRQVLAYPATVRAAPGGNSGRGSPEVIYLFAFYPADKITGAPLRFDYSIDSLQQTIRIEAPPRTAA